MGVIKEDLMFRAGLTGSILVITGLTVSVRESSSFEDKGELVELLPLSMLYLSTTCGQVCQC